MRSCTLSGKNMLFASLFLFASTLYSAPFAEAADIDSCGNLSAANTIYVLNRSVNSSGTCFTIEADNITLDGAGYRINYSQSAAGYGVNATGYKNITIKNLNIVQENSAITGAHAVYFNLSSNGTITNDSIAISSPGSAGVALISANNTNVTGGSIISSAGNDYWLLDAGATNNFTGTNFTAARNISFGDAVSRFNYNNGTGNIWLKTNISSPANITRTLAGWNSTLVKWNDTNRTSGVIANYNISGLVAGKIYGIYNTSSGVQTNPYTLTADSSGNLPSFNITLNGNTEIYAQYVPYNRTVNFTAYTSSSAQDDNVSIAIVSPTNESQIIASGTGSIAANLTLEQNYTFIVQKNVSSQNLTVKIINLNITADMNLTMQTIGNYTGPETSGASVATPVFAFNDTGLSYGYATLYIPNNGNPINKILHCTDWNFTQGNCSYSANWTINTTSEYNVQRNSTHFWFNTTSFDGFGGGSVYLEVSLTGPPTSGLTDLVQNLTFAVNATVYCRGGACGEVNGTVRYNASSANPDTAISTTATTPFYVGESPANSMKQCSSNLAQDASCNVSWIINATGDLSSTWKLGVLFNSSDASIAQNHTGNATVKIVSCLVDITTQFANVDFGDAWGTQRPALGNANDQYNITINSGSCNTDLYIKGTNLTSSSSYIIPVANLTFNTTNTYAGSYSMSYSYQLLKSNVPSGTNATSYYWLDVPSVEATRYAGNITIAGARYGEAL